MKNLLSPTAAALLAAASLAPSVLGQSSMTVSSFDGPVTASEISSYESYMQTMQPVVWPNTTDLQNEYAQGNTGEEIKALGLMYEMTGDTAILDRMIYFCDVVLEERNDLLAAPNGQRTVWTGTIAPVWPGNVASPASADSGNGDSVGHLAYCARLILQTSSILNSTPSIGDIYGHGATYGERAATFVAQADYVVSQFYFAATNPLLTLQSDEYYFSAQSPYKTGLPLPWNQQMMITYGLENLAQAHAILGDNPALVAEYDGIVQTNLNWFFDTPSLLQTITDGDGNTAYDWAYTPPQDSGEDSNHGALDVAGFYRAFLLGNYGITTVMMTPFANTYADIMTIGLKSFAGTVDGIDSSGHSSFTDYTRSGFLYLADFRPDQYYAMVGSDLTPGGTTTSTDTFSRFLWVKNGRYLDGYVIGFDPAPGIYSSTQSVSLSTLTSGASIRYTTNGTTPTSTSGTLYTGPFNVSQTTTIEAVSYTSGGSSPVTTALYSFPAGRPSISPNGGYFTGTQSMTLSSSTSGASIRYTTDGTIPTAASGTLYTGPVNITANTVVTAIAYGGGVSNSQLSSASFYVGAEAATPTISPDGGSYSGAQTVTLSCGTSGATLYYTTDGSAPTDDSTLYTGPFMVAGDITVNAIAVASGLNQSQMASAAFTIDVTVATPTISPAAGTYSTGQTVTLATATSGATLLFTVDGSAPNTTTGMVYIYLKPFKVAASQTVKAYAYGKGMTSSSISSNAYVINDTLPAGWYDADIGSPALAGSAAYGSPGFTVSGEGDDIYNTADQFNYAYHATSSDFTITSEVTSQTDTNSWAKSGVMARASLADDSTYVDVVVTPGKGIAMEYRTATGGSAVNVSGNATATAPYWLRLIRAGTLFTGLSSPDGVTWTTVGSVTLSMPAEATTGVAVCSHNTTALSTAVFRGTTINLPAQFSIPAASVSASGHADSYVPANTVDGTVTVANRWACSGTCWIQYDLGAVHTLTSTNIAWSYIWIYPFSIAVSSDGTTWTTVLASQQSNGAALEYQAFELPANTTGRYVRFNCTGSSHDNYTNISQTQIFGF